MSEKKQQLIFGGISLLVVAGLGTLIYYQRENMDKRRAEIGVLRKTIEDGRALIQTTPELVKKVIIQRETDSVIKEILADEQDINTLVRTLTAFGEQSGFTFNSIKPQKNVKRNKEDFERVGYSLTFEADVFQLLELLNKVESHKRFMSVTAIKLQAANRSEYASGELPHHRVTVDLETYVYAPTGNALEVKVDGYDKKKELLVSEISKRAAELRVPSYEYRGQRARRDPWIDPRIPVDDGPHLPIEEQITLVDDLSEKAAEVQRIWEEAKAAENLIQTMKLRSDLEEKLVLLEEEIRRVDGNGLLVFVPALRRFDKGVVSVVAAVRADMVDDVGGAGPSTALLRETADAMQHHIDLQEYEMSLQAFATIEPRLGVADQDPLKEPLVKTIRELKHLCDTVLAFEKVELDIQGVALYEARPPVVLINGTPYSEGEMLEGELVIHNIRVDQIEFAYHGLILARSLHADGAKPKKKGSARP